MKGNSTRTDRIEQKFLQKWSNRPNWAKRAMKRVGDIFAVEGRTFSLHGRDDLRDEEITYQVWFDDRSEKYKCSCYSKKQEEAIRQIQGKAYMHPCGGCYSV